MEARRAREVLLPALLLLLVGCEDRIVLTVSAPLDSGILMEDLEREIGRAERSTRRRLLVEEREESQPPLSLNGRMVAPRFPRGDAITDAIGYLSQRSDRPLIVAYPVDDERRGEEARLFAGTDAILVAVSTPENLNRTVDLLIEEGGRGEAAIVLLLAEHTPGVAHWLYQQQPEVAIIVEALFSSSVERMRAVGIEIAGAIVLDLAGTLDTTDNKRNDEDSTAYVPAIFVR